LILWHKILQNAPTREQRRDIVPACTPKGTAAAGVAKHCQEKKNGYEKDTFTAGLLVERQFSIFFASTS
jgi:hypothetical protein